MTWGLLAKLKRFLGKSGIIFLPARVAIASKTMQSNTHFLLSNCLWLQSWDIIRANSLMSNGTQDSGMLTTYDNHRISRIIFGSLNIEDDV